MNRKLTLGAGALAAILWSADAHALVESKCVTPAGVQVGKFEYLPDLFAKRRQRCVGDQSDCRVGDGTAFCRLSARARRLGLVPPGPQTISTSFHLVMFEDDPAKTIVATKNLRLEASCAEDGIDFRFTFLKRPGAFNEAVSKAAPENFYWSDDIMDEDDKPIGIEWTLELPRSNGPVAIGELPPTRVANEHGEAITLREGMVMLNSQLAPCIVSGTVVAEYP
jgi:hypothetical protein